MPRYTTAFDHNNDGILGGAQNDITLNSDGIRETGTWLKMIALIPYIKNLGANVIRLLPIMPVGQTGKKGDLGSPYSIKNHKTVDPLLADPLVDLTSEALFKAFVLACHLAGIAVITEFVLRTASLDNDNISSHHDWFYWINNNIQTRLWNEKDPNKYGSPIFSSNDLKSMKEKIEQNIFSNLPEPPQEYQNFFSTIPVKETIKSTNDHTTGISNSNTVRVASAFADWPPDDIQPPWDDVTYLRLYEPKDNRFNYIAYNTIRMYDEEYAKPENKITSLWNELESVIPHFQNEFNIDGAYIDMGHAMPPELMSNIIKKCRIINPNFCLINEKFDEISPELREEGYNAMNGCIWGMEATKHWENKVSEFSKQDIPIHCLATGETHDTPRLATRQPDINIRRKILKTNFEIPNTIPFINSGCELSEITPINTGLGFTSEEIEQYSKQKLPLFDRCQMKWEDQYGLTDLIAECAKEFNKTKQEEK